MRKKGELTKKEIEKMFRQVDRFKVVEYRADVESHPAVRSIMETTGGTS